MRIDSLHYVTDLPPRLTDVDQPAMGQPVAFDEGEKIVVERQQDPIVVCRKTLLFAVGIAERVFFARRVDRPAAATEAVGDRDPDTLVAVQLSRHTAAGSEEDDLKSSMWS